ncbi:beta-amylase 8-like protein [Trifolium pratense]|uniref:Beta-amylase 8-like protein n=1 Tax=Trifolium pratense TaxID=57577 RepID=A0A2K3JLI5_TRIPR|nr:beta-amylase 8-like protein [Trifolium pratense]
MLSRINQDNSLTEGGEEIPIDDGGRNIASEKENKTSQNLTSAEAHITVDLKNVNERLWEEFLKRVKKHDESEGMLKPPQIGEKVERRRLESMNATDVCVSDEPIARRERFNRTVGAQTAWGIQRARNRSVESQQSGGSLRTCSVMEMLENQPPVIRIDECLLPASIGSVLIAERDSRNGKYASVSLINSFDCLEADQLMQDIHFGVHESDISCTPYVPVYIKLPAGIIKKFSS